MQMKSIECLTIILFVRIILCVIHDDVESVIRQPVNLSLRVVEIASAAIVMSF